MAIRERIKKAIARRRSSLSSPTSSSTSSGDPSDLSSSVYYQPGEKIPYKYRRPVEPAHQKALDSFSFGDAWRSKSVASQYSPMGSRMPSRQNSVVRAAMAGRMSLSKKRAGSISTMPDQADEEGRSGGTSHLTPIESVPITRMEPADPVASTPEPFSQGELDQALQKASQGSKS